MVFVKAWRIRRTILFDDMVVISSERYMDAGWFLGPIDGKLTAQFDRSGYIWLRSDYGLSY